MEPEEVRRRIQQGEGQQVEFKASFAEAKEAIESLSAFKHADGGTVFFGVRDDGTILGVQLGKKTLEDFAHRVRNNTQPPLIPRIYQCPVDKKTVVAVTVDRGPRDTVYYAYNIAYIRVGKSNQPMPPDEQRVRYHAGFRADVRGGHVSVQSGDESWQERERRRIKIYERNRGLFLAHSWQPSTQAGQIADIVIYVRQHGEGPLPQGLVKSVEYHLGPKFSARTLVKTRADENFRLEVSAYGPMLCIARVNLEDGTHIDLERYIDF